MSEDTQSVAQVCWRRSRFEARAWDGRLLVRGVGGGDWLSLAGALRDVWDELEYPLRLADLTARIAWRYADPPQVVEAGLERSLAILRERGLAEPSAPHPPERSRYLWLLKRALVGLVQPEHDLRIEFLRGEGRTLEKQAQTLALRDIRTVQADAFRTLVDTKVVGPQTTAFAHTLSGLYTLNSLERCAEAVFRDGVPGDFMEAGVCQGGGSILLRALQEAHGAGERRLWVADSFQGVPPPISAEDHAYGLDLSQARAPLLAIGAETVRENFRRYDLLGPNVLFLEGWLDDTLPDAPIGPLALLRLDLDIHSSTTTALEHLYARVSPGGFVVIDDYGVLPPCREAVDAFRAREGVTEPIVWVNGTEVFWRKER